MSLVIRFVGSSGGLHERFLDMIHVADTHSESLMIAIVFTLSLHDLLLFRATYIRDAIVGKEMRRGRGLNQEQSLWRLGRTTWGTHFVSICQVLDLYDLVVKVLEMIVKNATITVSKAKASRLFDAICCFDFVLMLHIMKSVLKISPILSEALQRYDQDILNVMDIVAISKYELQEIRSEEIVKMWSRNKMRDGYLANAICLFVERVLAQVIISDAII
ncbi:hypothetical protein MPTK1_1g02760 [Marchantia polymorpha subsp. ruderalis]|uniref:Uncharacterized protein n=2 Tax=Marchantia polymorpha TaxID=3197 RepID=A0AAF6AKU4_MARPO|nr:hypothetical protein MARPO_0113s0024 [Marchantia polymorpha]BBM97064.1 hypothetical protein Mp_1g02760 [Marchantia polymorpha subsp. ruderalis]|eukprot:PTQ31286.1 hypothetical protein MARPO_0113s0024 [Marchantia polymorpha]